MKRGMRLIAWLFVLLIILGIEGLDSDSLRRYAEEAEQLREDKA